MHNHLPSQGWPPQRQHFPTTQPWESRDRAGRCVGSQDEAKSTLQRALGRGWGGVSMGRAGPRALVLMEGGWEEGECSVHMLYTPANTHLPKHPHLAV